MPDEVTPRGCVALATAIGALRDELTRAWWDGQHHELRFKPSAVELTLQVAVTTAGKASGGVNWWLLELGGEASRTSVVTQTVKMSLEPQMLDEHGNPKAFVIDMADETPKRSTTTSELDAPG